MPETTRYADELRTATNDGDAVSKPVRRDRAHGDERAAPGSGAALALHRCALLDQARARVKKAPAMRRKWRELGPRPLAQRLGTIDTVVSGRVAGIAVAPGGKRVYVASANGGVWRSEDGGTRWIFTMPGFDQDPQHHSSDSLACGAIAIDPHDPERVFVGTGEANTGRYYGVGPLFSANGGKRWHLEPTDGKPELAGQGFFELAVDPGDGNRVLGATTAGLYRREVIRKRGHWFRIFDRDSVFTSVRAGQLAGIATFVAAEQGGPVRQCPAASVGNPEQWVELWEGFPDSDVGRISLAVQGDDLGTLYALVASERNALRGLYRFDHGQQRWHEIHGLPDTLFATEQGDWSQALAIDPGDARRIYVGGSSVSVDSNWLGALYRCRLDRPRRHLSFTFIGLGTHADLQALAFVPGEPKRLWVGTDGGVFETGAVRSGAGPFLASRNDGLGTVTLHHLAQHPTKPPFFCGSQDNGLVAYHGDDTWQTTYSGDCGYAVVDWADPRRVLASINGRDLVRLIVDDARKPGEEDPIHDIDVGPQKTLFYPPLAGTQVPGVIDPSNQHRSSRVAFGAESPWLSDDFGTNWRSLPGDDPEGDRLGSRIRSLAFASFHRLWAGTEYGDVYRYDFDPEDRVWRRCAIACPELMQWLAAPITDIAVDPAVADGSAIYVTLGGELFVDGKADFRRLWHFDGSAWTPKSGPADDVNGQLLPVQHNAVAVHPKKPERIWVGSDIGVWYSSKRGASWRPFQRALPDAAVIDLRLHPPIDPKRLRAATHGRGAFEIAI